MIKASHHFFLYPFFKWYAKKLIKKHFSRISIQGQFTEKNLPVLLLSNHFSWWDGFFALFLNNSLLHRRFHVMMLEKQLRKYWFFRLSGAFSIDRRTRSIMETLAYTSELLTDHSNLVVVFPQGKLQSVYETSLNFEKGVIRIIRNCRNNIQILLVACFVDYFSNKKPTLTMYAEEYDYLNKGIGILQDEYQAFYTKCRIQQCKLAEE